MNLPFCGWARLPLLPITSGVESSYQIGRQFHRIKEFCRTPTANFPLSPIGPHSYTSGVDAPKDPIKLDYRKPVQRRGMSDRQKAALTIAGTIVGVAVFFYLLAFISMILRHLAR